MRKENTTDKRRAVTGITMDEKIIHKVGKEELRKKFTNEPANEGITRSKKQPERKNKKTTQQKQESEWKSERKIGRGEIRISSA